MIRNVKPTRDEVKRRYSRDVLKEKDRQASLLVKPKEITHFSKMPVYNPLRDRGWQVVTERLREIAPVSSVSSRK